MCGGVSDDDVRDTWPSREEAYRLLNEKSKVFSQFDPRVLRAYVDRKP